MSGTTKNFLKVLYEAIVPRRPQEPAKPETAPVHEQSWESYRHHAGQPGINRLYQQYSSSLDSLNTVSGVGKYMTNQFNAYCSEVGVQCTVQMDPTDYRQIFIFKNLGDRLVKIEWGTEVRFIEPNEHTTVKVDSSNVLDRNWNYIPRVTALNGGLNGD